MTSLAELTSEDEKAVRAVSAALARACVALPHLSELALSELAHLVSVHPEPRVETAGIFASGRLVVRPNWFLALRQSEATFVVAHELLHLALRTHERSTGSDSVLFNVAHDCIINGILEKALDMPTPAGGVTRHTFYQDLWNLPDDPSVEQLVTAFRKIPREFLHGSWASGEQESGGGTMAAALRAAGHARKLRSHDVLDAALERQWFPYLEPDRQRLDFDEVRAASARASSLEIIMERIAAVVEDQGDSPLGASAHLEALRTLYRPQWQHGLQKWLEAVAPGPRTWQRPSRRGADRTDVVLAGRRREGWTLHIVLDTSGSMTHLLPHVLGAIGSFCEAAQVETIHLLQCDADTQQDEWVAPEALQSFTVTGFGGSDMTPAMLRLAEDPQVEATIVLTDGYIAYPSTPMPYSVLWIGPSADFKPPYGQVIGLPWTEPEE